MNGNKTNDKTNDKSQRKLATTWRCSRCNRKLPTKGYVWSWRIRKHTEGKPSGYFCDNCAEARERESDTDY